MLVRLRTLGPMLESQSDVPVVTWPLPAAAAACKAEHTLSRARAAQLLRGLPRLPITLAAAGARVCVPP